ncbi:hypothetical protein GCM10020220_031810 [Nonomuraea rubra]|uniref:ATP-binding cassette domain-containing protein n=1 Tax=Nonomuraea rubra TaxID=46180 RepID=UPI0031EEB2A1
MDGAGRVRRHPARARRSRWWGASGSGKSTLARLLLALHSRSRAEIRYDGVPAAELNLRTLRRQFGVVIQNPSLFSGSIRENIALNDPGAALDRVVAAGRLAALHDEIAAMPWGTRPC